MEINTILKFAGVITALVATLFALRKLHQWVHPIHIEPSYTIFFDNSHLGEICAKIINRSAESQYILRCSARGIYSLPYILMSHIRNPLIRPSLYPNVWYSPVVFGLMKGEPIKLEPHQPVELSCKLFDHPLNAMFTPYFFVEVELSSGRTVRSKKLQTPERWKYIGLGLTKNESNKRVKHRPLKSAGWTSLSLGRLHERYVLQTYRIDRGELHVK